MILIDANALVVLLIGIIDPRLFKTHKTTSIYEEQDYYDLLAIIGDLKNLVVLPNVWTEVDNLLNNFSGNYKYIPTSGRSPTPLITQQKPTFRPS